MILYQIKILFKYVQMSKRSKISVQDDSNPRRDKLAFCRRSASVSAAWVGTGWKTLAPNLDLCGLFSRYVVIQ